MNDLKYRKVLTKILLYLTIFLLGVFSYRAFLLNYGEKTLLKNFETELKTQKSYDYIEKYTTILDLLKEKYYDIDEVKEQDLIENSIVGLLEGLKDPYTEYFNKKENKIFTESLSGNFEGIGAVLEEDEKGVKIIKVIENSPAEENGLEIGDIIISVNGKEISGMSIGDIISLIKGPEGKEVKLTILRQEEKIEKDLFTRSIDIPSVKGVEVDNEIGYIILNNFGQKTGEEFFHELEKFLTKKGIIIDLRQNGGGYLNIAIDILSNFIKKGDLLAITKYKDLEKDEYYSNGSKLNYNGKIVILVDSLSASASEIFSGAMKDYGKAILVGEKTYGKGSVQEPISLLDGSMIKITTAKWFTPKDKNIDKEGIEPDVKVELTEEDIKNKYDRQLEEAKKVLKSFIENNYLQLSIDKYKENNKN